MDTVFQMLICICKLLHYDWTDAKESLRMIWSWGDLIVWYKTPSSACMHILTGILLGRSLMKIGNKSGSNIKPWGAPDITVQVEEWEDHKSTTETYWIEKKEKKEVHLTDVSFLRITTNLFNRLFLLDIISIRTSDTWHLYCFCFRIN